MLDDPLESADGLAVEFVAIFSKVKLIFEIAYAFSEGSVFIHNGHIVCESGNNAIFGVNRSFGCCSGVQDIRNCQIVNNFDLSTFRLLCSDQNLLSFCIVGMDCQNFTENCLSLFCCLH